jgi:hypothetical protein
MFIVAYALAGIGHAIMGGEPGFVDAEAPRQDGQDCSLGFRPAKNQAIVGPAILSTPTRDEQPADDDGDSSTARRLPGFTK